MTCGGFIQLEEIVYGEREREREREDETLKPKEKWFPDGADQMKRIGTGFFFFFFFFKLNKLNLKN